MANNEMAKFYNDLQTVPKLVSDLALSIAEAQRRLDHDYIENLTEFAKVIGSVSQLTASDPANAGRFTELFRQMAPSRYQFTETVLEVRADIQMSQFNETNAGVNLGIKASVFALAINASYTKRSAYDARSAALIRTTLHAITSDSIMDKLLQRAANAPQTTMPETKRYAEIAEALKALVPATKGGATGESAGSDAAGSGGTGSGTTGSGTTGSGTTGSGAAGSGAAGSGAAGSGAASGDAGTAGSSTGEGGTTGTGGTT